MADCELLEKCIFFNDRMANMPGFSEMLKNKYCRDNFETCARYMIAKALSREQVPPDLFPMEIERAQKIISQAQV